MPKNGVCLIFCTRCTKRSKVATACVLIWCGPKFFRSPSLLVIPVYYHPLSTPLKLPLAYISYSIYAIHPWFWPQKIQPSSPILCSVGYPRNEVVGTSEVFWSLFEVTTMKFFYCFLKAEDFRFFNEMNVWFRKEKIAYISSTYIQSFCRRNYALCYTEIPPPPSCFLLIPIYPLGYVDSVLLCFIKSTTFMS